MKKLLISISIVALLASGVFLANAKKCEGVELKLEKQSNQCLSKDDYKALKKELHDEYKDDSKEYDFDINNLPLLEAVFSYEYEQGNFTLEGVTSKEELKNKFIDLLQ